MFCCFQSSKEYPDTAAALCVSGETLKCKVVKIYDGDTITVILPFCGRYFMEKCRIYGIDTPEIKTKNVTEKLNGLSAKEILSSLIENKYVMIKFMGREKYGRHLGQITTMDGIDIADYMIKHGHATKYILK